jgi:hypothetical protein
MLPTVNRATMARSGGGVQSILGMPTMAKPPMPATVADLTPGECAFVAPSALIVTADRSLHIQTDAPIRHTPDNTATMQVTRTADGYIADVTYCHFRWAPTDWADSLPHAPVVHVIFGDEFLQ